MDIDLNEDNYDYQSLLNLFNLKPNFDTNDLKEAKKKVLKLHPDKSRLHEKYFLFFRKMYAKIEQIYAFTFHSTSQEDFKKTYEIETHFKDYLERKNINPKTNFKEFSKEFNMMFEKIYVNHNEEGYGSWLKSNEDIYDKDNLESSRKQVIQNNIVTVTSIQEVGNNFDNYMGYDLKESHGKPMIALDIQDIYSKKPKFQSVQEYQQHLAVEDKNNLPLHSDQCNHYLKQKEELLNNQCQKIAYEQLQNQEKMNEKYKSYVSKYLSLE